MNITTTQKDIKNVIDVSDLNIIWRHLEKTFGLDVNVYQEQFRTYVLTYSRGLRVAECFVEFGATTIEPILNSILHRDAGYPTWNNLLRFLLKEKLAESSEQLQYYRSGTWKSIGVVRSDAHSVGMGERHVLL